MSETTEEDELGLGFEDDLGVTGGFEDVVLEVTEEGEEIIEVGVDAGEGTETIVVTLVGVGDGVEIMVTLEGEGVEITVILEGEGVGEEIMVSLEGDSEIMGEVTGEGI